MDGWAVSGDGSRSSTSKPVQEYQHETKIWSALGVVSSQQTSLSSLNQNWKLYKIVVNSQVDKGAKKK